jgi:hypothetical protein
MRVGRSLLGLVHPAQLEKSRIQNKTHLNYRYRDHNRDTSSPRFHSRSCLEQCFSPVIQSIVPAKQPKPIKDDPRTNASRSPWLRSHRPGRRKKKRDSIAPMRATVFMEFTLCRKVKTVKCPVFVLCRHALLRFRLEPPYVGCYK